MFDSKQPHDTYCFANRRVTHMKVLVHNGVGIRMGFAGMGTTAAATVKVWLEGYSPYHDKPAA